MPSLPNPTTCQERLATPLGSTSPTLFEQWRVFFYVPHELISAGKCCETEPAVFRLHPRRLESLTVRRCHYKGSTFFSFIQRSWVLVRPGFEPATFRSADGRSINWAYQAVVNQSRLKLHSIKKLRWQFPDVTGMYAGIMLVPREGHKMKWKTDKTIDHQRHFVHFLWTSNRGQQVYDMRIV